MTTYFETKVDAHGRSVTLVPQLQGYEPSHPTPMEQEWRRRHTRHIKSHRVRHTRHRQPAQVE